MNTAFRNRLISAGIDFTRFLTGAVAALAEVKNPKYAKIISQGAEILDAHLATTVNVDDTTPATAVAVATAEPDGGFPGSPRPGQAANAVNGHHEDTTAEHNKPGYVEGEAPPAPPAPETQAQRIQRLENSLAELHAMNTASQETVSPAKVVKKKVAKKKSK